MQRLAKSTAAALLMSAGASTLAAPAVEPLTLGLAREGDHAVLTVVGNSNVTVTLGYELKVEGASRVHQSGRVSLSPGLQATPVRIALSPATGWTAVLTVTGPDGGYTRTLSAAS
jgi:FtsP/CotA-like multicopper oxidase with cupredoxin domain